MQAAQRWDFLDENVVLAYVLAWGAEIGNGLNKYKHESQPGVCLDRHLQ